MEKLRSFLSQYKYMVLILIGVLFLVVIMIVTSSTASREETIPIDIESAMKQDGYLASTQDFTVYQQGGKIYVEVMDSRMTDETVIRNTFGIDPSIPIVIYVPGAAERSPYYRYDNNY